MKIRLKTTVKTLIITTLLIFIKTTLMAAEITESNPANWLGCKPIEEKESQIIRNSQNPKLLTGAALVGCSTGLVSDERRKLLESASRIESPKGLATLSLIELEFDEPWIDSPLKPSTKQSILNLLHDDKDNAQSYYLYALLQMEAVGNQESLSQIVKGNEKTFKSYSKQRFNAIVEAAEKAKLSRIQARQCAFPLFSITNTYSKLRHLCQKLVKSEGQEAKNACFVMGQNLEEGSLTFIEQITSLNIQSDTLNESTSAAGMAIKKRRDTIKASLGACFPETDLPEDALLHYYEILLDKGEASARDFLSDFVKQKH